MPSRGRKVDELLRGAGASAPPTSLRSYFADFADKLEQVSRERSASRPSHAWREWVTAMFPRAVSYEFAPQHIQFWEWLESLPLSTISHEHYEQTAGKMSGNKAEVETSGVGVRPDPFVGIWPRGWGKTTNMELGIIYLGATGRRRYAVIVSETQDQANDKVSAIASKLESDEVQAAYPSLGDRELNKYGVAKSWRRDRLRTASNFIVDALGLDTASRGLKVDHFRPDLIVWDDIDGKKDSETVTDSKIMTLTDTILPIGTQDAAVLCMQNLIIPRGVFGRMVNGEADYLVNRIVSGPVPSIEDLEVEVESSKSGNRRFVIVSGKPTWEGQGKVACQKAIDTYGYASFLRECQHEVDDNPDALWSREMFEVVGFRVNPADVPDLVRVVVGVDPQGSSKRKDAATGIVKAGIDERGHVYVLLDDSLSGTPDQWASKAVDCFHGDPKGDVIVGEVNYGGDMVGHTIATVDRWAKFDTVRATRGKVVRAEPVVSLYERGLVHHVGTHLKLEKEMTTWTRDDKWSPNRIDALVWAVYSLVPELQGQKPGRLEHAWMGW